MTMREDRGIVPAGSSTLAAPSASDIERDIAQTRAEMEANIGALGQKLRISGTPTIFLADGSRIGGYLPAAELEKAMSAVAAK